MSPSSTSTGTSSLVPTPLSLDSPPPSTTITFSSATPPRPTSPTGPPPPHTAGPSLHPAQSASTSSSSASSLGRSKSASRSRNNLGSLGRISTDSEGWKRTGDSLGRKKVRTRPPFAEHERESPPTSPKSLLPVSSASTHPRSSPSQTSHLHNSHHDPSQASSTYPFHTLERTISPLQLSLPESFPPQPIQPKQGRRTAEPRVVRPGDDSSDEEDLDVEKQSPEGKRHEWWLLNKGKAALNSGRRVVAFGLEQQHSYFPDTSTSAGDHTSSLPNTATTASSSYPSSPALPPLPLPLPRSSIEGDQQPAPGSTNPNTPQRPAKTRRSSHFPSFHIPLPRLDLSNPYSAHQSKTPGWEEPYSSAPFLPVDPEGEEAKRRTRLERAGHWLLYSYWTPLVLRALNFGLTAGTMGVGIKIRALEAGLGKQGITGSSPVVAIIYTPITLLHVLVAVYLEYFGRPVGLWSLSSKLLFTSLDLLSISLWSSLLSLSLSDLLSTPLTCVSESARWWTTVPVEDIDFNGDHDVCSYQIALVVTVAVGTVGFLVNFFVSLGRVLAKVLGRRR